MPTCLTKCEHVHEPLLPLGQRVADCTLHSVNVIESEPVDRQMTTGNHTVRDIECVKCHVILGWKYVRRIVMPLACPR